MCAAGPPNAVVPRRLYTPKISFAEGFAATAAWYRQAGWLK